ncbi:MAG: hypothetical protein ABFE13_10400 [Phycisphaerales bacterium]
MDTPEQGNGESDTNQGDADNTQAAHSPQDNNQPELVRISRLAVIACALAVLSLLLLPGFIRVFRKGTPQTVREVYAYVTWGAAICAGVLGVVSLARIGLRRGRLTGRGFAWAGILAPAVQWLLFLVVILPALPRSRAFRMTCGTHLAGIGKAMLIYANDYEDEFPRAGGPTSQWTGRIANWTASNRRVAYGLSPNDAGGDVSISSSLYLLVKYAEVTPESFLCGAGSRKTREKGVTEFKLGMYRVANPKAELIDFWDFGPNPPKHCSYAYHMLYGPSTVTVSSSSNFAIAGDRNPWMDSPSVKARDFSKFVPDIAPYNGTSEQGRGGNSFRHEGQGQNVMFLDSHVEFEKRPFCGLNDDNIYTSWNGDDKARGVPPDLGSVPADAKDSLLVNDPVTAVK